MKITVIGGGPGGLYFSILLKKAMPDYDVSVYERNKADDSFGFGVVFSDETLSEFLTRDPDSYELIRTVLPIGMSWMWHAMAKKYALQEMDFADVPVKHYYNYCSNVAVK